MNISPVNSRNSNISFLPPSFYGAAEDFGHKAKEIFTKVKVDKNDEAVLTDMFEKAYCEIMSPERYLGSGFFGNVYAIDENFAVKMSRYLNKFSNIKSSIAGGFKICKRVFRDLKTYYGEPLCSMGRIEILKNVGKHVPAGVPTSFKRQLDSSKEYEKYYQQKYLPLFAKVPQESYDALISDISKLNKMKYNDENYYEFDSKNPGNILLSGNKLLLTDQIEITNNANYNSVGKLLETMLYKMVFFHAVKSYGDNLNDAREILRKIIIASEKVDLPYDTRSADENIWNMVLLNCYIDMDADEFIQNLEYVRGTNPKISDRVPKIEKFLDNVYKN